MDKRFYISYSAQKKVEEAPQYKNTEIGSFFMNTSADIDIDTKEGIIQLKELIEKMDPELENLTLLGFREIKG